MGLLLRVSKAVFLYCTTEELYRCHCWWFKLLWYKYGPYWGANILQVKPDCWGVQQKNCIPFTDSISQIKAPFWQIKGFPTSLWARLQIQLIFLVHRGEKETTTVFTTLKNRRLLLSQAITGVSYWRSHDPGGGRKPVKACCGRPWIVFVAVCKQEMSLFCTLSQWLVLFLFCFQKCFADYRPDINMTWYVCSVFKCAAMMHQRTQPFRTSSRPCLTRQVLAPNAWT